MFPQVTAIRLTGPIGSPQARGAAHSDHPEGQHPASAASAPLRLEHLLAARTATLPASRRPPRVISHGPHSAAQRLPSSAGLLQRRALVPLGELLEHRGASAGEAPPRAISVPAERGHQDHETTSSAPRAGMPHRASSSRPGRRTAPPLERPEAAPRPATNRPGGANDGLVQRSTCPGERSGDRSHIDTHAQRCIGGTHTLMHRGASVPCLIRRYRPGGPTG